MALISGVIPVVALALLVQVVDFKMKKNTKRRLASDVRSVSVAPILCALQQTMDASTVSLGTIRTMKSMMPRARSALLVSFRTREVRHHAASAQKANMRRKA